MNDKVNIEIKKKNICIVVLFIVSLATYMWTVNLPIIGDGLMHLNDTTDIGSLVNIIKSFYTFEGIGKAENSSTLIFHRPIFDELLVEIIKNITGCNIMKIRFISVLTFAVAIMVSYFLGFEIFENYKKAFWTALFMNFSFVYFNGIYEFGLSFSLWLTLFMLLSFYNTVRYVKYNNMRNLIGAFIFSAITIYTKESAMTLGIALSWYVLVYELCKNRKITKRTWEYGVGQFIILVVYLITRYIKLGSLFTAAAGIDAGNISLIESIKKTIGYYFLLFNIPNEVIPNYMCVNIDNNLTWLGILLCGMPIALLICFFIMVLKRNSKSVNILTYMVMYFLLILPVFKVSRNAPYYGDIFAIFVILSIITVFDIDKKKNKIVLSVFLMAYLTIFITNMYSSVKPGSMYYLSTQSNEAMKLRDKLLEKKDDISTKRVLLSDSWLKNNDDNFTYHHNYYNELGSFYKFNIDNSKEIDMVSAENIFSDATIIDFYMNHDDGKMKVFLYPDRNNKIVRVKYDKESNENLSVGFLYKGYYYSNNFDMNFEKQFDSDNYLYFVIPKECDMDVDGQECIVEYMEPSYLTDREVNIVFPDQYGLAEYSGGWLEQAYTENYRWICKEAKVIIKTKRCNEITIEGYVPEEFDEVNTLEIYVNGKLIDNIDVKQNAAFVCQHSLKDIVADDKNGVEVTFKFDGEHQPDESSADIRIMSGMISHIYIN